MSDDLLSQDDINDLLGSIGADAPEPEMTEPAPSPEENGPNVSVYDYGHPELFTQPAFEAFSSAMEQAASEISDFMKKESGKEISCSLDSISQQTVEEYRRSLPDYCFGLEYVLPNIGRAVVVTNPISSSGLSAMLMDIPMNNTLGGDFMSCAPQVFRSAARAFLSKKFSNPVSFRDIETVPDIVFDSTFEIVVLSSIVISFNDQFQGLLHCVFPFNTIVRLFPDAFSQFTAAPGSLSDSLSTDENGQSYNGSEPFRRSLVFQLKDFSLGRVRDVVAEGSISAEAKTMGKLVYTHED